MRLWLGLLLIVLGGPISAACPAGAVCLAWPAVTANTDGSPLAGAPWYNVYRGAKGSTSKALIGVTATGAVAIDETGQPSGEQCYNLTTVAPTSSDATKSAESVYSNEVCVTFAPSAPTDGSVEAPSDGSVIF